MLTELFIRNFAIIDDLRIRLSEGLTILSGETGAGKSIIISAVNLLLGARATAGLIRTGSDTAELEALFHVAPESRAAVLMKECGHDPTEGLLIRRIISRADRHRIYINGRLATLQTLTPITEHLASISGQHAHQGLLKEDRHLVIIDQFGRLIALRDRVRGRYRGILPLIDRLKDLRRTKERQAERMELLAFQKQEIESAAPAPGEDETLEMERIRLKNAETLYRTVHASIQELYSADGSISERLAEVRKSLEKAASVDSDLSPHATGVSEAAFQIEDSVEALRGYLKNIRIDDQRLEEVEDRLDLLRGLKRKYGGSLESVLERLESISREHRGIENLDADIEEAEKRLSRSHDQLADLAAELSRKRGETADRLAGKVEKELHSLKMSNTAFEVSLQAAPADPDADPHLVMDGRLITESGVDRAQFLIAPNVGEKPKPLADIASGGELSRVVLALKAILASVDSVETVVFDEVDAGIGGGVAEVVGKKLTRLARAHQIICSAHLPQIAKFGDHHFRISKGVSDGRTRTAIEPVSRKDRVKEIARMLGGEKITRATMAHAREMLKGTGGRAGDR